MRRVIVLLASIAAGSTASAAPGPSIWPVAGLYGFENTACRASGDGPLTAMIDPSLCAALSDAVRKSAGRIFAASVTRHFPGAVATFAASLPAAATPRARLSSGLIASLRLTRASIWTVPKGRTVDGFLPLTLTLDITNPATGEVVFTRTRSDVGDGVFSSTGLEQELAAQLPRKLASLIEGLVAHAARDWRPQQQTATVVGRAGEGWVVDKGRLDGLRADDSIGADGRILSIGPHYAIVRPTLGEYRTGERLERTSVAPADRLGRPTVLTALTHVPASYSPLYLGQVFEDALGAGQALSPMPVNPGFASLRELALGEAQMPSTDPRPLPEYVAAVSVIALKKASFASNIAGVNIERHAAFAFVTLVDRSGRVVHAVQGEGRIEDKTSGDMRFSEEQRRDTVIRNALLNAAAKLATFKPRTVELAIRSAGVSMLIDDKAGALPLGAELTVLRPAGRVGSVDGVYYPVGSVQTREASAAGVVAANSGPNVLKLRHGDMISLEQTGTPLAWRGTVSRCFKAGLPAFEDRGQTSVPIASMAADAFFPARFAGPVRLWNLPSALGFFQTHFGNWASFTPARAVTSGRCYVPVIAVARDERTASAYALTAGFTMFDGDAKISGSGLQATLTPTRLPAGTPADQAAAVLDHDIARTILPLLERAAAGSTTSAK